MFDGENGDFDIQQKHINNKGSFVVTAGLSNSGILGKSDVKAKIFPKNTITIDMFGNTFYRNYEYKMVTHARVFSLIPKLIMSENIGLFISISMFYLIHNFGYENMCLWSKIKDDKIKLPIKDENLGAVLENIDFVFMENFIRELEEERIRELAAYLKVSGYSSYELLPAEQKALKMFEKWEWKEYRIGDLFGVNPYKKRFDANKVDVLEKGNFPYVVRTALNNGVKGYLNESEEFLNEGNTISFGQDTATMFYQEKPYFTGDKIKIFKPKHNFFNKKQAMYFITSMSKVFSSFSWGSARFNVDTINNQYIQLPVAADGSPDYEAMETLISAVQKLVIKDVVLYADRKIAAAKKATGRK